MQAVGLKGQQTDRMELDNNGGKGEPAALLPAAHKPKLPQLALVNVEAEINERAAEVKKTCEAGEDGGTELKKTGPARAGRNGQVSFANDRTVPASKPA